MVSESGFIDRIWSGLLVAVAEGSHSILIWGFNQDAIVLIGKMNDHGLGGLLVGLADPRKEVQGIEIGHLKVLPQGSIPWLHIDTVVIATDEGKELALTSLAEHDQWQPRVVMAGTRHMEFNDPVLQDILSSCLVPSRAAGYRDMLVHIYQGIRYIARKGLNGHFAEFGVYKGGTAVFMAKTLQRLGVNARIYAFDTFGGFPPRGTLLDLYSDTHDEFADFEAVSAYCRNYPIQIIQGDISETYRALEGIPLALTFFDTDNYTPTRRALEMCYEQTVSGGILAFDHYFCDERWLYTLGERIAVDEVLRGKELFNLHGTGIFLKI